MSQLVIDTIEKHGREWYRLRWREDGEPCEMHLLPGGIIAPAAAAALIEKRLAKKPYRPKQEAA